MNLKAVRVVVLYPEPVCDRYRGRVFPPPAAGRGESLAAGGEATPVAGTASGDAGDVFAGVIVHDRLAAG